MGAQVAEFTRSVEPRRGIRRHRCVGCLAVVIVGFALIGCSSSNDSSSSSSAPSTSAPATTTEVSPPTTGPAPTVTPTTAAPTTTPVTTVAPTTSVPPDDTEELSRIWFVRDERLGAAYRADGDPQALVEALLAGPIAADQTEADPTTLTTAIPDGVELLGLAVDGDVATVDLSRSFESGGGSLSMTERVAQVVYTLTEIPGVARVAFSLDGEPVTTIGGEGIQVSPPVGRDSFDTVKPLILATEPRPGQLVSSPLQIVGENSTSENNIEISLRAADGRVLVETFATGTGPIFDGDGQPVWGPFETTIEFDAGSATSGVLALTETASDGSGRLFADVQIPVNFALGDGTSSGTLDGASTDAVVVPSGGCCEPGPTVLLTDVTAQQMEGFDRIVFEFTAPVMNYNVRYVPLPITEDPSDLPVQLQGDHAIQISMGATGTDQTESPVRQSYTGPTRLAVGTGAVLELVQNGDFEAVSNWVLGTNGQPPFRVTTESNPDRLVIDVASPG